MSNSPLAPKASVHQAGSPAVPRWVKVFLIAGAALVLALIAAMVLLPGDHGPSRHTGAVGTPPTVPVSSGAAGTSQLPSEEPSGG